MAQAESAELVDRFEQFYRQYYKDEIGTLAQGYPAEHRSLYVDWGDLYRFDRTLADDLINQPGQLLDVAEEALRLYDLPVDVSLGQAHVRVRGLQETTPIRDIRSEHVNTLVSVTGMVRKATGVRPKIQQAAFECQRCGTLTRIPQTGGDFQEPHECQGCERQGPFRINFDQSEFIDSQKLRIQESPEGLRGGETPEAIDVHIEDDATGKVTAGDHVTVTGVLHLEQQGSQQEKSPVFDVYMDGVSVEIEDEEFEELEISESDKQRIIELSEDPDIYEAMVDSIAPSIYGYREEKLAMILQLFSGVTKHLPDGSRTRGDLHLLLIGDPGTGKCVDGNTKVTLGDGTRTEIRQLVESNLEDPKPVDDGVWDEVDFEVPSLGRDGQMTTQRATRVWKREAPDRMFRITTSSGRVLEVTPSHPLFVHEEGQIAALTADELSEGQFVGRPRSVPTEASDSIDVSYRRSKSPNAVRLDLPSEWKPSLARLIGYIIAEGHVVRREDHTGDCRVTNNDREILDDVADALERLGLPFTETEGRKDKPARGIRCTAGEFVSFLENLEPAILEGSGDQRVPDDIFRAAPRIKRAFLRAYIESEGHVSASQREIAVASMSRELLAGVGSLLNELGIDSQLHARRNRSHRLRISGDDFATYVQEVGFVTERKSLATERYEDTPGNTNQDVVPGVGPLLERVRRALAMSQHDLPMARSTYQHYERGDRNPSVGNLRRIVECFEDRLLTLLVLRDGLTPEWEAISTTRSELNVSQQAIADRAGVCQRTVSLHERGEVATDGGLAVEATDVLETRVDDATSVLDDIERLRKLAWSEVRWDQIETIETVEPDDEWVYDLEVEGTHNYVSNGVLSHNSQLLQYIRHIAPRSVYTSGKGSSAAGLCVTGDTMIHTGSGFTPIRDLAETHHPEPVTEEMAAETSHDLYTFDRESGTIERAGSSHVWRMPEKPCRAIETRYGKEIEASVNTPLLVCTETGLEWREISDIEPGDHVAVPKYDGIERSSPPVRAFLEFTEEKLKPTDASVAYLRRRLREEFGTLRDAAAALKLSEDFIYESLSNRHLPQEKLGRILDAIDADLSDIDLKRAMLRHGDSVRIPERFDEDLMYLVGLVFGDGDVMVSRRGGNRGLVRISNSDEELLHTAADIIDRTFDKTVEIEYQEDRVPCIRVHSATVARFFSNIGVESPKEDISLDPRLTTATHADAFLRGLFDADGCVSARDHGGSSIQYSTTCGEFAEQIQLMLETYGVRAKRRERDRRGTYELASGQEIESKSIQTHLEIYGRDIDAFADEIGFRVTDKSEALADIVRDVPRRGERLPLGDALLRADGAGGQYYQNLNRGDNPSRERAKAILTDRTLGDIAEIVEEVTVADLGWDEVVSVTDSGKKEVFDLSVPKTHNFLGNGIVTHNTAAAVRDDFGDGNQWTLEAGALVLADRGIAAVDELDKMRSEDRSAMHEALEQQSISISKAGINATLKSRCSLLGAANPKYGRFDQYEPIGEQIDLEPALISRFDLIFTVTDQPDPEQDGELADHILQTNYAGELNTQRTQLTNASVSQAEVDEIVQNVEPAIDAGLVRKYIAYAKRTSYPTMSDEAKAAIRDFYVSLRAKGADEDAPVPVTARKLEALVRLAEASARVRLSDTVEIEDAERVIEIVRSCLQDIGVDPETGQFDADVVETGTSKTQRDRIKTVRQLISSIEDEYDDGAPIEEVLDRAEEMGTDRAKAEHEIEKLKQQGEVYEPQTDHLRTT